MNQTAKKRERASANLQHFGVTVDVDGKIELSDEAKHIMKQAPWILKGDEEAKNPAEQTHGPAQRTLSKIMRNIAKIEASERWTHSNEREKERRPEAGDPGTPDGTLMPNASGNTSEDWVHQYPTEHQMQAPDKWRFFMRSNT